MISKDRKTFFVTAFTLAGTIMGAGVLGWVFFNDMLVFDYKFSEKKAWLITSLSPLALYLIIQSFNLLSFSQVLGIGGVISGGLSGILILLMVRRAKRLGDRKPEYAIPINKLIIYLISLVFILGVVAELFF